MARKNALAAVASGSKALATIDQELANEVANLKQQIGQPSGRSIKVKPTGNFVTPDGFDLGSEISVVVVDFISKNLFYDGPYDPNNPAPPACFAFGKNIAELKPDVDAPSKQHDVCATCPLNQFGSGNNGKSKACKNTYELAVILADPQDSESLSDPSTPIYTISLPPTALNSFKGAVAQIQRSLGGPPIKAILTVMAKNVGTYAAISFVDPVPNPHYAQHFARRAECTDLLFRKPDIAAYQARQSARPAPRRAGAAPKTAAGGRR